MIDEAVVSGTRKEKACEEIDLSIRTLQRWQESGKISVDKRVTADRPEQSNKLTKEEQQAVLDTCNQEEYANLGPSQIVPMLANNGQYRAFIVC
ncbi:IS3 family transposase ISSba15 [Pseudoalteromonas holothuriae]|uniref:IS3 family transposase ISSba15 n=1 Tax=Pseudoalteromonas holothuriae TaxID=2963714 RepID=A0ABM9GNF5_9GAMM|nr:IS3 family transposase ISSba15 [Pseudoalteromonas sp. CIP111951]